jgi:hypothetical protein
LTEPRYVLKAYVCENGKVVWRHDMGATTLTTIFVERDVNCRYAVLQEKPNVFQVADMYDVEMDLTLVRITRVGMRAFPDLDAAIMSCMLVYDPEQCE